MLLVCIGFPTFHSYLRLRFTLKIFAEIIHFYFNLSKEFEAAMYLFIKNSSWTFN